MSGIIPSATSVCFPPSCAINPRNRPFWWASALNGGGEARIPPLVLHVRWGYEQTAPPVYGWRDEPEDPLGNDRLRRLFLLAGVELSSKTLWGPSCTQPPSTCFCGG